MKRAYLIIVLVSLIGSSCNKYLDKIPDKSLSTLKTLQDYQQLLDYSTTYSLLPNLGDLSCDDYYFTTDTWLPKTSLVRNCYIWAKDIYQGNQVYTNDWNNGYNGIYIANVALDGIDKVEYQSYETDWLNEIKAQALMIRAYRHLLIQETFGKPYKPATINSDLGIPLKSTSDLSVISSRATVNETYQFILTDLFNALNLTKVNFLSTNKNRASKAAICAIISRTYLIMQQFEKSKNYAELSLSYFNTLLDYNTLSTTSTSPFAKPDIIEVVLPGFQINNSAIIAASTTAIDSVLYRSYNANDLRKSIYFRLNTTTQSYYMKGMYSSNTTPFAGIATDEIYLNSAEAFARLNILDSALLRINQLLGKRFKNGTYTPITSTNSGDLLKIILLERRKELIFRGIRWMDLRRLNQDVNYAITIKRVINGTKYELTPEHPNYSLPIPDEEIALSGLMQNIRN